MARDTAQGGANQAPTPPDLFPQPVARKLASSKSGQGAKEPRGDGQRLQKSTPHFPRGAGQGVMCQKASLHEVAAANSLH